MGRTILLCSILAIVVFSAQLLLCLKAKRDILKRIPLFTIIAVYLLVLILSFLDLLIGSGGVAICSIFAFIIAVANTVALTADILAWIIYKLIRKRSA